MISLIRRRMMKGHAIARVALGLRILSDGRSSLFNDDRPLFH
jgi:hypothetical protein